MSVVLIGLGLALVACSQGTENVEVAKSEPAGGESSSEVESSSADDHLLQRAADLDLGTAYEPPPGDPLMHHMSGYAKVLCSAVYITGLTLEDAAANVGGFTAPFDMRHHAAAIHADPDRQSITVELADGRTRTAARYLSQGCVTHEIGKDGVNFTPSTVEPQTPDPATTPWPMGDLLEAAVEGVDQTLVAEALEAVMAPEGRTLGFVATHKGKIIAEAYGDGVGMHPPFESWSMGMDTG
jgi:hypothetical protein